MKKDSKKILQGILIGGGVVIVCLLSFFVSMNSKDDTTTSSNDIEETSRDSNTIMANAQKESTSIPESEKKKLTEIDISKYLDLYSGSEKSLVLIARPTCSYCQIAEPIIRNVAYKYDIEVNYLNTDELSESDEAELVRSDDYFSSGYGTPLLLVVSDKKIVDKVDGLTDSIGYKEFFTKNGFINE